MQSGNTVSELNKNTPNSKAKEELELFLENYQYSDSEEDVNTIDRLITQGAAIDKIDVRGKYLIHYACQNGHIASINLIVMKFGVSIIKQPTKNRSTPLHLASEKGQEEVVRLLLNYLSEVDCLDGSNSTPLHLAAKNSHFTVVELLLTKKQKYLDSRDTSGNTPLSYSVYNNQEKITEILLKHNADPNLLCNIKSLLIYSIEQNYESIVRLLLANHARLDVESINETLDMYDDPIKKLIKLRQELEIKFFESVKNNKLDQVSDIYREGVYVECIDNEKRTPLSYALERKYWELSAWLISKDADLTNLCTNIYTKKLLPLEWQYLFNALDKLPKPCLEAPIHSLFSKTFFFSEATLANFDIYFIYKELFGDDLNSDTTLFIKYTRPILEVVANYAELTIKYDPQAPDVYRMNSAAGIGTVGYYSDLDKILYIAGKRTYEEVRGTLIHELCHLACELIWKNERNPYFQETEQKKKFTKLCHSIYEEYKGEKKRKEMEPIIAAVFEYPEDKHARELIVRVPQLVAEKSQDGIGILQNHFSQLLAFYEDYFLPSCQQYLDPKFRLKQHYLQQANFPLLIDSNRNFHINDFPVNLSPLIEDTNQNVYDIENECLTQEQHPLLRQKGPITSHHLFKYFHLDEKMLILGPAGMGKSTLCQYILFQWASSLPGANKFDWVFIIPLRNLNKYNYPDSNKEYQEIDIIFKECMPSDSHLRKTLNNHIYTDNVLWILDGYDELPNTVPKQLETALIKLLKKTSIIITSRPNGALNDENIKIRFEITGFSMPTIRKYMAIFFNEDPKEADNLLRFLEETDSIKNAYIPINLELICSIWKDNCDTLSQYTFFNRTQLYHNITLWLMRRFLIKENYDQSRLNVEKRVLRRLSEEIQVFEKIAFYLMLKQDNASAYKQLEVILSKIQKDKSLAEDIRNIGFLTKMGDIEHSNFEFIHQSFQEFFAARYLIRCLSEKQNILSFHQADKEITTIEQFVANNKYNHRYEMVWWFVAGLLKEYPQELMWFFNQLEALPRDIFNDNHIALIIRCLDESQVLIDIPDKPLEPKLAIQVDEMFNALIQHITQSRSNHSVAFFNHRERFQEALALSPSVVFAKDKEEFFFTHMNELRLELLVNARSKQAVAWLSRLVNKYDGLKPIIEVLSTEPQSVLQSFDNLLKIIKQTKDLFIQLKLTRAIDEIVLAEPQLLLPRLNPMLEMLMQEKENRSRHVLMSVIVKVASVETQSAFHALDTLLSMFTQTANWHDKLYLARAIAELVPATKYQMALQRLNSLLEVLKQTHDPVAQNDLAKAISDVMLITQSQSVCEYFNFLLEMLKQTKGRDAQRGLSRVIAQITLAKPQMTLELMDNLLKEVLKQTQDELIQLGLIQVIIEGVLIAPQWALPHFDSLLEVLKQMQDEYIQADLALAITEILSITQQLPLKTFNVLVEIFEQMKNRFVQHSLAKVIAKGVAILPQLASKALNVLLVPVYQTEDWIVQGELVKAIARVVSIEPQLASKAFSALLFALVKIFDQAEKNFMHDSRIMQDQLVKAIAKIISIKSALALQAFKTLLEMFKQTEDKFIQGGLARAIAEIVSIWPKNRTQSIELAQKLLKFFEEVKIMPNQIKEEIWRHFNFANYPMAFISVMSSIKDINLKLTIDLLSATRIADLIEAYQKLEATPEVKKALLTMLFIKCYSESVTITLEDDILTIYLRAKLYSFILSLELKKHVVSLIEKYSTSREIEEINEDVFTKQNLPKSRYYSVLEKQGFFKGKPKSFETEDLDSKNTMISSRAEIKRRKSFEFKFFVNGGERWESDPNYASSHNEHRDAILEINSQQPPDFLHSFIANNNQHTIKTTINNNNQTVTETLPEESLITQKLFEESITQANIAKHKHSATDKENEEALKNFQKERLRELKLTWQEPKTISDDESSSEDELISSSGSDEEEDFSCKPSNLI